MSANAENKPNYSRLPRPASSPDKFGVMSLKRKASEEPLSRPPSKAIALSSSTTTRPQGLRASASARNIPTTAVKKKPVQPSLTVPRPPLATSTNTRPGARVPSQPTRGRAPSSAGTAPSTRRPNVLSQSARGRSVVSPPPAEDDRWALVEELQKEVVSTRGELAGLKAFKDTFTASRAHEVDTRREFQATASEMESLRSAHARDQQEWDMARMRLEREARELREELRIGQEDLAREREAVSTLKSTISQQANMHLTLETQVQALRVQGQTWQSQLQMQESQIANLELELETARKTISDREAELRDAEGLRRKLHNTVMELKGNIRVFCRVRPALPHEKENAEGLASIAYPDKEHREIVVASSSETATGGSREAVMPFSFDRVFQPQSTQAEVFEEISQLAQSCTDGYNVCVFGYGQTSSGKTYTMEGGTADDAAGMIPRAVRQIFAVTEDLTSKGWQYKMEGQFIEIYNETINDLLGTGEMDKKKHEIKHEKSGRTTVTDVITVPLESASQVRNLLLKAQNRRTVHATLMNERSSRSHSVFTLRVVGSNSITGEACEGSLNLVDLAGSERLSASGAANDKDRLKETQAINKSLSALGDVIAALGEKGAAGSGGSDKGHIPYRNSKLTYLLQNSLSGNSKTLMVLNLSPLAAHLNESLCSLRFATKVNNTNIGTARKQVARISS